MLIELESKMAKTKEKSAKEMPATGLNLDFRTSPVVYNYFQSDAFVQGLMGPVGSGKSYACAAKIMKKAVEQKPAQLTASGTRGGLLCETATPC